MRLVKAIVALSVVGLVAACQNMSTDERNAVVGGVGGAAIAAATDSNVAAGAAIGAAGGALCNDVGICK